jgi:hypothetical protein
LLRGKVQTRRRDSYETRRADLQAQGGTVRAGDDHATAGWKEKSETLWSLDKSECAKQCSAHQPHNNMNLERGTALSKRAPRHS